MSINGSEKNWIDNTNADFSMRTIATKPEFGHPIDAEAGKAQLIFDQLRRNLSNLSSNELGALRLDTIVADVESALKDSGANIVWSRLIAFTATPPILDKNETTLMRVFEFKIWNTTLFSLRLRKHYDKPEALILECRYFIGSNQPLIPYRPYPGGVVGFLDSLGL